MKGVFLCAYYIHHTTYITDYKHQIALYTVQSDSYKMKYLESSLHYIVRYTEMITLTF